ncbi:MAG TPA: M13 family metallopeptidase, partial [Terriglobales bacterium]
MRTSLASSAVALVSLLTFGACSHRAAPPPITGVDMTAIDTHANPCQDFYQYACGNWMAQNPIPADQTSWGTANKLVDHNQDVLHGILEAAAAHPAGQDAVTQQVGAYYAACMNTAVIDKAGVHPLQSELDNLNGVSTRPELAAEIARLQVEGVDALFTFGSDQDAKDADSMIAGADQGGLGLPDRDYYTRTDAKSVELRQQYRAHIAKMFGLMGDKPPVAAAGARTVLRIETALARAAMGNVERRDPNATYHKMPVAQFEALAPAFAWQPYFAGVNAPPLATINAISPGFFRGMNRELQSVSLTDWKTYLRWHLVHNYAAALSQPFVEANFDFFGKTLTGQQAQKPRWKRCVASTDSHLGEALGQLYVRQAFTPQAKAHMTTLVHNLEQALGQDIASLDWMSPATKQQAMVKLHAIVDKIGYPDKWRDYSSIIISSDNYVTNLRRTNAFEWRRDLAKIGKPVDRGEWEMTPPTVNAYYTPIWNQIVFPAGILQPPFFSATRDDAVNYGAVGLVMGHELTHGFDDQGRQFDAHGNLHDWWTAADAKAFQERAACLVDEYSGFTPLPGVHLNGKLTLGENTADNGGAQVAYRAMQTALAGQPDTKLDGFTRDQRFFVGYAQVWCENTR